MGDLDILRPEVQEAMHRLENYLHITIDGKHFRSEDYDTIRAELLRLANENFMLNRINVAPFKQELDGERMHVAALTARCQRAQAELEALRARIAEAPVASVRVDDRMHVSIGARSNAVDFVPLHTKHVALVKVEE